MNKYCLKFYVKAVSLTDKLFKRIRKKQLNNTDFSIICNNCWAGYVYRRYGLPYLSPTVGLYFFAEDFVKLCSDLRRYMNTPLQFISFEDSRYKDILVRRNHTSVPIARIDDIEVVFLHYKSEDEAREKWERRASRVNYDNLIFKFSKMNLCEKKDIDAFDKIAVKKKICFLPPEEIEGVECAIAFKSARGEMQMIDDTSRYSQYINLTKLINAETVCGKSIIGKRKGK